MRPFVFTLIVTSFFLVGGFASIATGEVEMVHPPKGYVCHRATDPMVIDGKLDEASWANVPWTDEFDDIENLGQQLRPKPTYKTRAKMLWDDEYLYVGAMLEEPHVWAKLTKRDSVIFYDNDFEVFIDPDNDNHQYYEIELNARNTVWDLRLVKPYRDGGPALTTWDMPGMKHGAFVDGTLNDSSDTDKGWSCEFAFRWDELAEFANTSCPPKHGDQWRINFSRVEWCTKIEDGEYVKIPRAIKPEKVSEDNWVWSPQGVVNMHVPERWGYLQFSTAKVGEDSFRPDPTLPARDALVEIYHKQGVYRKQNKKFATNLADLGLQEIKHESFDGLPTIKVSGKGYEAATKVKCPDGKTRTVTIRQDSRIQVD